MPKLSGAVTGIALGAVVTLAQASYAQQSPHPTFEVATIRRSDPGKPLPPSLKIVPGRFEARSMALKGLIAMAYQLTFDTSQQISGGPSWINSEKFDIVATEDKTILTQRHKLPSEQQGEQYRMTIQELLSDRFKLSIHRETRELTTYTLVLAKSGPKLKPGVPDPNLPSNIPQTRIDVRRPGSLAGHNSTMNLLAKTLGSQPEIGGRTVIDKTGLKGEYDFTLKWMPESGMGPDSSMAEAQENLPQLFTALQEQLGLRFTSTKAPVDVIIVDHAEMPSDN